jgi:hypothetical protein
MSQWYIELAMMLACAVFYYRFGELEFRKGFLLGFISVSAWLGTSLVLHWGWLGCLGVQVGIYGILTILNLLG